MRENNFLLLAVLLLSVLVFVMFAVTTGVAHLGWSQNIDQYKEKLDPWIFDSVEFFLSYGIIFQAVVVVFMVVIILNMDTKKKKEIKQ